MIEDRAFAEHVGMALIAGCLRISGKMAVMAALARILLSEVFLVAQMLEVI